MLQLREMEARLVMPSQYQRKYVDTALANVMYEELVQGIPPEETILCRTR